MPEILGGSGKRNETFPIRPRTFFMPDGPDVSQLASQHQEDIGGHGDDLM
jgi:hypothetical protein